MMISPSSSQLGAAPPTARLADSLGQPVKLGSPIGKGGEGIVYEVADEPGLAAKIYHDAQLEPATAEKLQLMVQQGSPALRTVAAWPTSVLYEEETEAARGILMPRIDAARQLHELYGTTNRKRHFPGVLWHHMLLAARNTAAAFHAMHEAGVIVGDVNQGNLLVDDRMRVRFIDCDSFQIAGPDVLYTCPVGTPHFTPGELQSQNLRDVERTVDHDAFGLAVLIFHLVFVGRHPFAGRFRGEGDLPIERAIGERRFAFARDRSVTQVDPPPASLSLDDLPAPLANLFEGAFRADPAAGDRRPSPTQWAEALDHLMSHRKVLSI